jgi:DNA-binding transcriptional ArsR family regulator
VISSAAHCLDALSDRTRRRIFERVASAPASVASIAADMPISRPAVSQHLRILKEAGLVTDTPEGTRRIYRVDPAGIGAVRDWLDQFWGDTLADFKAYAEAEPQVAEEERR